MRAARMMGRILVSVGVLWLLATLPHAIWMVNEGMGEENVPDWYWVCFPIMLVGAVLWGIGSVSSETWRELKEWLAS